MHRLSLVFCLLGLFSCSPVAPEKEASKANTNEIRHTEPINVPEKARPYVKYYLDHDNPSRNMAQAEQECGWNHYAVSRVGALGCAQAMPDTLEWGAKTFARHLGKPQPHNPRYAAEFLEAYMKFFTVHPLTGYCPNRKLDEQRYNGGFYVVWEVRQSDMTLAGGERLCGTRLKNGKKRSVESCHENYNYPRYISRRQVKYLSIGGIQCN